MTVNAETIRAFADAELTGAQLGELAAIDQAAELAAERGRWTAEIWDRTSPINGAEAEHFLARDDVSDAPVYLLIRDGHVVYFQPHHPNESGLVGIEQDSIEEVAAAHLEEVVQREAGAAVISRVLAIG